MMHKNILICGVGGQGTVLLSRILAASFMSEGHPVHSAETIGMAQRGGSVQSHIREGEEVFSPLIPRQGADLILSFEPLEAIRNLNYLKAGGMMILNSRPILPVSVTLKGEPFEILPLLDFLEEQRIRHCTVDSDVLCQSLGSVKFFNLIMLGIAAGLGVLDVDAGKIREQIAKLVKPRFVTINQEAFALGIEVGRKHAT